MGKSEPKIFLILRDKLLAHAPGFGSVPVGRFGSGNAKRGVLISCVCVCRCMCTFDEPALGFGRVYYVRCGLCLCLACTPDWE